MNNMERTIKAYAKQHRLEYTGHKVLIGMNFTHCVVCGDHAHYWKPGYMIQHNSDYTIHNRIALVE